MTLPPAARPTGPRHTAPTTYLDHAGEETPAVCPSCRRADRLVLHATTPVEYRLAGAVWAQGHTTPLLDVDSVNVPEPAYEPDVARHGKIACTNCRWSYTGPRPLERLGRGD